MKSEMKPGREVDALVAEKVMGIRVTFEQGDYWPPARPGENFSTQPIRAYSTNIAAAWEVVENLNDFGSFNLKRTGPAGWIARLRDWRATPTTIEASAPSAPHAICLAALKAVGA